MRYEDEFIILTESTDFLLTIPQSNGRAEIAVQSTKQNCKGFPVLSQGHKVTLKPVVVECREYDICWEGSSRLTVKNKKFLLYKLLHGEIVTEKGKKGKVR